MKYAVAFAVFAVYLTVVACQAGGAGWLLLWPAASFALVSTAYAVRWPGLLGKRPDGRLSARAMPAALPFLLLTWGVWHVLRRLSREPCCHEIAPGLWLGRRPLPAELPAGVGLVVDLTAEFAEPVAVRGTGRYRCLPVLDASTPPADEFWRLVGEVAAEPGAVYVHCAMGHGRSGLFVVAVLLVRGLADDPRQAEELVRQVRSGVRLKPVQRRWLAAVARWRDLRPKMAT